MLVPQLTTWFWGVPDKSFCPVRSPLTLRTESSHPSRVTGQLNQASCCWITSLQHTRESVCSELASWSDPTCAPLCSMLVSLFHHSDSCCHLSALGSLTGFGLSRTFGVENWSAWPGGGLSRALASVLRHNLPEGLQPGDWVPVEEIYLSIRRPVTPAQMLEELATNVNPAGQPRFDMQEFNGVLYGRALPDELAAPAPHAPAAKARAGPIRPLQRDPRPPAEPARPHRQLQAPLRAQPAPHRARQLLAQQLRQAHKLPFLMHIHKRLHKHVYDNLHSGSGGSTCAAQCSAAAAATTTSAASCRT